MAEEIQVDATLAFDDSIAQAVNLQVTEKLVTVSTKRFTRIKQSIATTETAIDLGGISSLGWGMIVNRDSTNFVNLKVATGGAIFAKLLPGECAMLRFGSGAQAPYAIADTSAVEIEILLCAT